jgi:hypothetical protein
MLMFGAYLISPGVQKRGDIPGVYGLVVQTGGHIFAGDSTAPWSGSMTIHNETNMLYPAWIFLVHIPSGCLT